MNDWVLGNFIVNSQGMIYFYSCYLVVSFLQDGKVVEGLELDVSEVQLCYLWFLWYLFIWL